MISLHSLFECARIDYFFSDPPEFPESKNLWVQEDKQPSQKKTTDIFSGKSVVVFTLPEAYTKLSRQQLKEFAAYEQRFYAVGVTKIVCLAKDTIGVLTSWHHDVCPKSTIQMVSDPSSDLPVKLEVVLPTTTSRLGNNPYCRSSIVLRDGKIVQRVIERTELGYKLSTASEIFTVIKQRYNCVQNLSKNSNKGEEDKKAST